MDSTLHALIREIIVETLEAREGLGEADEKEDFIKRYMTTFLSTWAANHYEDACGHNEYDILVMKAPLEDARDLAEKAWKLVSDSAWGLLM